MTFAGLNAAFVDLRNSVRSFVGDNALQEITIRPPASDGDELSFVRLVAWCYAFVFESGRVTVPYLLRLSQSLPGNAFDNDRVTTLVHDLRTWNFHNLGYDSERDAEISRRVQRWFRQTCQSYPPHEVGEWRDCFVELTGDVRSVILLCQRATTMILADPQDGEAATNDLRRRVDRAWPPHEFHRLLGDIAIRLGSRIDLKKFTATRLHRWRTVLENVPDSDDPEDHVIRMIERDLLEHYAQILPIDGRDVMQTLGLDPGPEVGAALRHARRLFSAGIRDRAKLLEHLQREVG